MVTYDDKRDNNGMLIDSDHDKRMANRVTVDRSGGG